MTKIAMALQDLHDAEQDLVLSLERMGERHHADHEVVHVTRDLARWSVDHIARIAPVAARYDLDLSAASEVSARCSSPDWTSGSSRWWPATLRQAAANSACAARSSPT